MLPITENKWCQGKKSGCVKPVDKGEFTFEHYHECMYKCQELSCLSARFVDGKCFLSSQRCDKEEIGPIEGLYFHRLSKYNSHILLTPHNWNKFAGTVDFFRFSYQKYRVKPSLNGFHRPKHENDFLSPNFFLTYPLLMSLDEIVWIFPMKVYASECSFSWIMFITVLHVSLDYFIQFNFFAEKSV